MLLLFIYIYIQGTRSLGLTFGADADDVLWRHIGDDPDPPDDALWRHIPWRRIAPWRRITPWRHIVTCATFSQGHQGIISGIYSGTLSDISDIVSDNLSGISSGILSGISSGDCCWRWICWPKGPAWKKDQSRSGGQFFSVKKTDLICVFCNVFFSTIGVVLSFQFLILWLWIYSVCVLNIYMYIYIYIHLFVCLSIKKIAHHQEIFYWPSNAVTATS